MQSRVCTARVLALAVGLLCAASAHAISHHDQVAVKPIRKGGELVGFKLNVILKSGDFSNTQLGLGRSSMRHAIVQAGWDPAKMRGLVFNRDKDYVRFTFPEEARLEKGTPREVEYEVLFGQGNDLKPGDTVDVFSAWRGAQSPHFEHFYGVFNSGDHKFTEVKLPEK
jgi:hypothetical protein